MTPTIASIKQAVAEHYGVPVEELAARNNRPRVSHPRQLAMCLASRLTSHSYARIGHFFGGRDHSTVLHAKRAVEQRCASDPSVHSAMRAVTLRLVRP